MKALRTFGIALVLLGSPAVARSQSWQKLNAQPPFNTDTALLLTDGTVMTHEYLTSNWWKLTPDNTGSYLNGTWSEIASMPSNYGPLYYASAVLADGRVIVEGGEDNLNQGQVETNLGAIYNPKSNTWTAITAPTGWTSIGDSPGVVLSNGTFMMGRNVSTQAVLFNAHTLTWTTTGSGKNDIYSEEGWLQLPDRTILTTDGIKAPNAEKYIASTGSWVNAGNTIVRLEDPGTEEIGPMILRPDGTAFAMGANASAAGHTSTYTPPAMPTQPGTWTVGPDIPNGNDMADAPAAILPNGDVLCDTSPGIFRNPVTFYEYNGTSFSQVPGPASASHTTSYQGRMLVLPTGEVLYVVADGSTIDAELFTGPGTFNSAWQPAITSVPSTVTHGVTFSISGTQFNGVSDGANYGDDAQMNTNYPLVRITNNATGHVFYCRTHNHSTMGVATGTRVVSTRFDVPGTIETGASTIEVVANGIPSAATAITVN